MARTFWANYYSRVPQSFGRGSCCKEEPNVYGITGNCVRYCEKNDQMHLLEEHLLRDYKTKHGRSCVEGKSSVIIPREIKIE